MTKTKKIAVVAAVAAVLLMIALTFAILGMGGYFGRSTTAEKVTYSELEGLDMSLQLPKGNLLHDYFTAYPEEECNSRRFTDGKVACVGYEITTSSYWLAAARGGTYLSYDIFSYSGEKAGESAVFGDIYACEMNGGGATLYYAEKEGARYALIAFDGDGQALFDKLF